MLPWQHILETVLMRNRAIQLSNDVTVPLFLNESFKNVLRNDKCYLCKKLLAERKLYIAMATHVLRPHWVLEIIDDVTVTSFCNHSQQNFVFLFVIPRSISIQSLSKIEQETKKLQKWENTSL